jgi:hypothetical protein
MEKKEKAKKVRGREMNAKSLVRSPKSDFVAGPVLSSDEKYTGKRNNIYAA